MNPKSMDPFGKALHSYFGGDTTAELIIRILEITNAVLQWAHG
ncbi:MAG: hypothetical protein ACMUIM_01800 [bacterium]